MKSFLFSLKRSGRSGRVTCHVHASEPVYILISTCVNMKSDFNFVAKNEWAISFKLRSFPRIFIIPCVQLRLKNSLILTENY